MRLAFDKNKNEKISLPSKMSCYLAEEIGIHIGDSSMNFYMNRVN